MPTPSTPYYYPADPSNPNVQAALAWNHLSEVPPNWVMDKTGSIHTLDPEGTLGPMVGMGPPRHGSIWRDLAHTTPYIAAAFGMGALGGLAGAGGPAASAVMPAASGVGGMTATSLGLGTTAGLGTAGTAAVTGGAASSIGGYLKTAKDVSDALGAISSGRVAGRQAEDQSAYYGNRNIIDLYKAQQDAAIARSDADLRQKDYTLKAPQLRANNSVRGDIMANAQDATVSGVSPNIPVPTISGGLRPSMFSQNTRDLGGLMSQQALDSQKAGDTFSPLPSTDAPSLMNVPQPGKLDSILNIAGSVGSLASLIPYTRTKKPVAPSYYDYNESGGG